MSAAAPWGAYVHVPWCRVRCPYCAFAVVPLAGVPEWSPFVARVLADRTAARREFPGAPATLFFGGGTPSRLPGEALSALVSGIGPAPGAEISAEVNPEDLDEAWLAAALDAGVNRISLGVQSFETPIARRLGRGHTHTKAIEAARRLGRAPLRSWSLDLIFAVPGQTLADLDRDLDRVLALEAPHVSLYGLTFEEGTRFEAARRRGRLRPPTDDAWREMYDRVVERLKQAGLARYEVSNFAREGHRSIHNQLYWSDAPYLGLGPSAHGYTPSGERWAEAPDLGEWLAGAAPARERPDPEAAATDLLVSALRGVDGVDLDRLAARTGLEVGADTLASLARSGWVVRDGPRLRLTDAGFPLCDAVVGRLSRDLREIASPGSRRPGAGPASG